MGGASLPPGFRFHPTDEELVGYYLKRKVDGLKIELEVIPVIDLYKFDPWELPGKSFLPSRDMEWFFFCPRDRKYPNGSRTNRATKAGYWKATGKDRKVACQSSATGYRKTLVFYRGRAPLGDRTDWVMHEYRLCDDISQGSPTFRGAFALCRVVKKNEQTSKTSDFNGDYKGKRVGAGSSNEDFAFTTISNEPMSISNEIPSQATYVNNEIRPIGDFEPSFMMNNATNVWVSPDLILDSSKEYPQVQEAVSQCFPPYDLPNTMNAWQPHDPKEISPSSSYSNFTEEYELADDLSRMACMSPYPEHMNYIGFYGNMDSSYGGSETWNQAPICRQASGDSSFGELWSQDMRSW